MQAAEAGMTMCRLTLPYAKVRDAAALLPACPHLARLLDSTVPAGMGRQCVLDVTIADASALIDSFAKAACKAQKPGKMLNCGEKIAAVIRDR